MGRSITAWAPSTASWSWLCGENLPHEAAASTRTYHVQLTDLIMGGRPDGSPRWVLSAGQVRHGSWVVMGG